MSDRGDRIATTEEAPHRSIAPNPLGKRWHPVRFAPISPISVHYSDDSRAVAIRQEYCRCPSPS